MTARKDVIYYKFHFASREELAEYLLSRGIDLREKPINAFDRGFSISGFFDVGDDFTTIFVKQLAEARIIDKAITDGKIKLTPLKETPQE